MLLYSKNLEEHAAYLHLGSGMTNRRVKELDHLLFCENRTKKTIADTVNGNLPSLEYVKSVNGHLDSEVYQKMFETFVNHVHDNKEEPNYSEMGRVFNLKNL